MTQSIWHNGYFSITDLSKDLSIDKDLIRHYESKGLVAAKSTGLNQRVYSQGDRARLKFITRARHADYSLKEIESLIGRIPPHGKESDDVEESLLFAENKFNALREQTKVLDALEQINIACDLELLSGFLKELNALRPVPHVPNKNRQRVPEKPQQPAEDRALPDAENQVDAIPSIVDVIGKRPTGISKKYLFVSIFLMLLVVIGSIFMVHKPEGTLEGMPNRQADHSSLAANADTMDSERTNHNPLESTEEKQLNSQQEDDERKPALPPSRMSESSSDILPSDEFSGEEGIDSEAAKSELVDKLISDMQSKYDTSPTATTASKKDLEGANSENGELEAVADVTASLALVQNAKKKVPNNKQSSSKSQRNLPNKAAEPASLKQPLVSEKPSGLEDPPKTAAKTDPDEKPAPKAPTRKVEKETAKESASKSSAILLAAVPVAPKAESTKPTKPSSAISKKAPASNAPKQKVQPTQELKDKPKQPQPPKQKASPVRKPALEKSKTETRPSPAKQLASIDPAALDWARKSRESFQMGDMSETIVSATVSISIEPGQVQPYIDRALAYRQKGLFEKAIADCNQAMVNDPGSAMAVYTRGGVYQAMGETEYARIDYAKACDMGFVAACDIKTARLDKKSMDKLMKQSRESFRKGDWDAVILATNDVLKQDPANVTAYVTRSAAYSQKKMFTDAISDCDTALKIDPGYALAYNNRGYAWEQLGKTETAKADYEQACSLGLKLGCKNYEKF